MTLGTMRHHGFASTLRTFGGLRLDPSRGTHDHAVWDRGLGSEHHLPGAGRNTLVLRQVGERCASQSDRQPEP
jgi:hypothetical protein